VINTNGQILAAVPAHEWVPLEHNREIALTDIPSTIRGALEIPAGIPLARFNGNYGLDVAAELIVDHGGAYVATRYETFVTSPAALNTGIIVVPKELMNEDPASLEVRFEFEPGGNSRSGTGVRVVKKGSV
jgi:hypothetical protein